MFNHSGSCRIRQSPKLLGPRGHPANPYISLTTGSNIELWKNVNHIHGKISSFKTNFGLNHNLSIV